MKIHRDILTGLLACTASRKGSHPAYVNLAISADGKKMYAANGYILAVGDIEGGEEIANAVIDANDVAQLLRDLRSSRLMYVTLELDYDTRDGKPSLTSWVPALEARAVGGQRVSGETKRRIAILHDAQPFASPVSLINEHPTYSGVDGSGCIAIKPSQLNVIQKVMKPFSCVYVMAGYTSGRSSWWIGRAQKNEEIRLLVMPAHPGEWPE